MMTMVLLDVASKAARMAEQDPNGWIMTLVAVCVVFLTLFMLQYCYRFVGWLSTRDKKEKSGVDSKKAGGRKGSGRVGSDANDEVAAAIATALSMESSGEIQAAIGLALDRWFSESVHDKESYIITIKRKY